MRKEQPFLPTRDQSRSSPFLGGKRKIQEIQLYPVFRVLTKQTSLRPERTDVWFFDDGSGRQALCCGQDRVQVESWGSPRHRPRKLSRSHLRFVYGRYWSDKKRQYEGPALKQCSVVHVNILSYCVCEYKHTGIRNSVFIFQRGQTAVMPFAYKLMGIVVAQD